MRLEWLSLDNCGLTSSVLRLLRISTPTAPSAIAGTSHRMDRSCCGQSSSGTRAVSSSSQSMSWPVAQKGLRSVRTRGGSITKMAPGPGALHMSAFGCKADIHKTP